MSTHLASLAALAALWLAVALLVSLAARVLWPIAAHRSATRDPEIRARRAFFAAVAPVLVPSAVVLLCSLPGLLGALTGRAITARVTVSTRISVRFMRRCP